MSVYIHIPFCESICSYCDFTKFYYDEDRASKYLDALKLEVLKYYKNDLVKTIYIGGGTPSSLSINNLKKLFDIIKLFRYEELEFTFECNIDISEEKLKLLKQNGVNRISIGLQSISPKLLKIMNRIHTKEQVVDKINVIKKYFNNINIDLIYALKDETILDLNDDLKFFLSLDVAHISTYSLIIEKNTLLYINKYPMIDEDIDYKMYKIINKTLVKNGYINYEISNYCKKGYYSRHNLTYWNNLNYYGFGIGASGYINDTRYDNTKSYKKYISGFYRNDETILSIKEKIENEFILGFRKINGISIEDFKNKYSFDLKNLEIVKKLVSEKKLLIKDDFIKINPKYIYTSNSILLNFIDFMDN